MSWLRWFTRKPVLPTAPKTGDVVVVRFERGFWEEPAAFIETPPGKALISIPIDRATEYVPELGNIRSCVRPEEYVYDWQKDGL